MHGIVADSSTLDCPVQWIKAAFPGIYVKNVEIGDGIIDSIFMNMNDQVSNFCEQIKKDTNLVNGFNLIGYSQGGLIARGYVERCNNPPVYNLITWSAPHGGEFGVPLVNISWINDLLTNEPYNSWVQANIGFAGYWRDPWDLSEYVQYADYLPDLNNLKAVKNATYKQNIESLNNLVVTFSNIDVIIHPAESGWFWVYQNNSDIQVYTLAEQEIYTEDFIGLRSLNETGRMHFYTMSCLHQDIPSKGCEVYFNEFTLPYLNNTLDQVNPYEKKTL